jgi:prepilin-type N-terminal cleavage/methylation domain-containing protein
MCFISKPKSSRRERTVAVDWHDCAWSPAITVQAPSPERGDLTKPLPALPSILHTARCHPADLKIMKTILPSARRHRAGFTLVELLVVIAIIGILAALLLPVMATVIRKAKMAKAKTEAQAIATAVESYDSQYGRFPVSTNAQNAVNKYNLDNIASDDFTFGGTFNGVQVQNPAAYNYQPSDNSEVIAILTDVQNYPGSGNPTVNNNHVKNPKQTIFLNAHMSGDTNSSGVGTDLIYRDPWGNPYVISLDLNYDEVTEDAFYEQSAVSGGAGGLAKQADGNYAFHGKVMVWSAGPDGKISKTSTANLNENKDNVTSW